MSKLMLLKSILKIINFNVIVQSIENVKIFSNDFNAFKITTFLDERDKLFNADLWPEGMIVNKFYRRKS